jgi:hypothetical protein
MVVNKMANTPLRSFRISDDVYDAAKAFAELRGISVTELIVSHLELVGSSENVEAFKKAQNESR